MTHYLHKVFNTTEEREIYVWIITVLSILSAIVSTYGLIIFWKKRSQPFIKKRHPALVFVSSICFIVILALERPLAGFVRLSITTSEPLQWIRWIIHVIFYQTLVICILFRVYITCFDIHFAKANAAQVWVKYIDIQSKRKKTSFIVSKYNKYGNLHKIHRYIIGLIVFVTLLTIILTIIHSQYGFVANATFFIAFTIIVCIMWLYTPAYLDHFKIRVEIRIVASVTACLVFINLAYFIISITTDISFKQWFIIQCFAVFFLSILSFTQTFWVLHKFKRAKETQETRERENSASEFSRRHSTDNADDILELDIIDIVAEDIGFECFMSHLNKEFSMENLLGVIEMTQYKSRYRQIRSIKEDIKNGIDPQLNRGSMRITKVMLKVIKSLSVQTEHAKEIKQIDADIETQTVDEIDIETESVNDIDIETVNDIDIESVNEILATTKLKKSISKLKRNATKINITEQLVELPESMPFSTIVYGEKYDADDVEENIETIKNLDLETEAKRIIHELYLKYIYVGSEMELNLSHRLRKRCLEKLTYMDHMDDIELEHMFDKSIAAVLKLMQDSYLRFKETKEFIRYEEKAKKKIRNNSIIKSENLGGMFSDLL